MNQNFVVIIGVAALVMVVFLFVAIWTSRFVRVGPNQALIVSGRKVQRPDGTVVGYRIVKGGGTFVFPIVERADVLLLEVFSVDMVKSKTQTADGHAVQASGVAQIKINGDDVSLAAAAERFLGKSQPEISNIVRPVLEKHLSSVLAGSTLEAESQNLSAFAERVQAAAAKDLAPMGLSLVSFTMKL